MLLDNASTMTGHLLSLAFVLGPLFVALPRGLVSVHLTPVGVVLHGLGSSFPRFWDGAGPIIQDELIKRERMLSPYE